MDFSTGGWLIMSQPNGLLILGDHLFLNYKKNGQRGLINTAGIINPNLTLVLLILGKHGNNNKIWPSTVTILIPGTGNLWLYSGFKPAWVTPGISYHDSTLRLRLQFPPKQTHTHTHTHTNLITLICQHDIETSGCETTHINITVTVPAPSILNISPEKVRAKRWQSLKFESNSNNYGLWMFMILIIL